MAVTISSKIRESVSISLPQGRVYEYLSNVDRCISEHFPGLEKLVRVSDNQYRWEFKKLAYSGYQFAFSFVTQFRFHPTSRIDIEPIATPGSGTFSGAWRLEESGQKTNVTFEGNLEIELAVPFFVKGMATPIVQREIGKLFEQYLTHVANALSK